jgi:SulP family sulfate permease
MAGMLQIAGGMAGVGKLLKLIPHPVMLGFVNGLAIVMTKAQLMHFKTGGTFMSLTTPLGASTYGIAALTMALVKLIPKVTKAVPPSLGAVAISSFVAKFFSLPAKTLADVAGAATFKGGLSVLPSFGLPSVPLTWETVQIVFPYALTMASVGVLESLLTMQILDDMADDGKRGSSKKECIGQGTGNIMSGLTQGIGGCVLLGQSIINMQSGGGVSRWSGMSMALLLATGIVAAAPLLANVPVSALVGVMLLVCQSTFSWSSLRLISKIPKLDAAVIALVSIVTFQKDLAVAVLAGTMLSALGFAYKQSSALTATYSVDEKSGVKTYKLQGPLFFGSTQKFEELFSSARSDPSEVRLDFSESRVLDHSGMESLETLSSKYAAMGKTVKVENLCMDSTKVLAKYSKGRRDALPFQFSADTDVENGTMRQNSSGKAQAAATKTW